MLNFISILLKLYIVRALQNHFISRQSPSQNDYNIYKIKDVKECLFKIIHTNRTNDNLSYYKIGASKMRKSWTYYKYYSMGANTIFGHFLPFLLIMVLNILVVRILRRNQQEMQGIIQDEYNVCDFPLNLIFQRGLRIK